MQKIKIKYLGFWSIQICSWAMLVAIILLSSCGSVKKIQNSKSSFVVADTTGKQERTEQTIVKEQVIAVKDTATIHTDSTIVTKVVEVEFYPQADTAKSSAVYATSAVSANREIAERPRQLVKKIRITEQTKTSNTDTAKATETAQNSTDSTKAITTSTEVKAAKVEAIKEQTKEKQVKRGGWVWAVAVLCVAALGYLYFKNRKR